jgi:hypothetical protein
MVRLEDEAPATVTSVINCNADLRPAAVPNSYINFNNVQQYIAIAYAIYSGDTATLNRLVTQLTKPTIEGYRFADDVLFRAYNLVPKVSLQNQTFGTRLGDIFLWVHPDWQIDTEAVYSVQVINQELLEIFENQYQVGSETCAYPGEGYQFPE